MYTVVYGVNISTMISITSTVPIPSSSVRNCRNDFNLLFPITIPSFSYIPAFENAGTMIITITTTSSITIGRSSFVVASSLSFLAFCIRSSSAWTDSSFNCCKSVELPFFRFCVRNVLKRTYSLTPVLFPKFSYAAPSGTPICISRVAISISS